MGQEGRLGADDRGPGVADRGAGGVAIPAATNVVARAPPALFVAGVAVVLAIGAAVPKGFDSSRSEMENAVAQARSHPPGWSEHYGFDTPRQVGHVEVWKLSHREDGVVVVSDADFVFGFHMRGWAHSL